MFIRIALRVLRPRRVNAAGHFEPARVFAPVAATGFAVPLGHAFPFFTVGENRAAGFDLRRLFTSRNAVNDRHDIGRTALRAERCFLRPRLVFRTFLAAHITCHTGC